METQKRVVRGVAGIAGGLVACWVMNQFIAGPGVKLQQAVQTDEQHQQQEQKTKEQERSGEFKIDATMKTADAMVNTATAGRHLVRGEAEGRPHRPLHVGCHHWRRSRRPR